MPQNLKVILCSHQPGATRFPDEDEAQKVPLGTWRNNVTALSQHHNLYLVAYLDRIYVYQPRYPDQIVGGLGEAVGYFELPKSRPRLRGYINPGKPQGVNHLMVRALGEEEILILACDGGDVIAYRIRDILKVLCQPSSHPSPMELVLFAFFHENVGASVWGIDVHRTSRLIAISSNSHEIVIFAFALTSRPDQFLVPCKMKETLRGVASSHDYGHGRAAFLCCGISPCKGPLSTEWKVPENGDCRFRRTENNYAWSLRGHSTNIPAIAFYNNPTDPSGKVVLASTDINRKTYAWDVWDSKSQQINPNTDIEDVLGAVLQSQAESSSMVNLDDYGEDSGEEEEDGEQESQEVDQDDLSEAIGIDLEPAEVSASHVVGEIAALSDSDRVISRQAEYIPIAPPSEISKHSPCNFLCTTESDVFLTDGRFMDRGAKPSNGRLLCEKSLMQAIPSEFVANRPMERLNMVSQIPELGLVAIGNQVGRVGLYTMTFWPERQDYGFKVEAILPFDSEERQGKRPHVAPLLGIAVSPVQGHFQRPYSPSTEASSKDHNEIERKFRLLMYYTDHTILAYEISRPIKDEEVLVC
ncbi:uncharacterized protein KY384_003616 [Bacidia gigantensis]|uniref:uncharacterized protein n=1 Tax=Bacidia gigantensis TaxID=2732470 RepID=UPI001D051B14|nr:uncharacterized protein KY384_003616 [Bacidia gigantensis]KAG8531980.1 hypothetical protein KY384_003616 [Bacidia gigantensis]